MLRRASSEKPSAVRGCLVPLGEFRLELELVSLAIRAVGVRRHVEGTSGFERELAELIERAKAAEAN